MTDTRTQLLDLAESGMRQNGYHAVSFRDLADQLGIKSASVHYYFRKKEDLGVALVTRYSEQFFTRLDATVPPETDPREKVATFCAAYRAALTGSDAICLCGMLGAEMSGLPVPVADAVRGFFRANIDWLVAALPGSVSAGLRSQQAAGIFATLQGAVMISHAMKNTAVFDDAVAGVMQRLPAR